MLDFKEKIKDISKENSYQEKINSIISIVEEVNNTKLDLIEINEISDLINEICDVTRVCSICHNIIVEGYVLNGGEDYFCSEECLYKEISKEEWDAMTAYLIDPEDRTEKQEEWYMEYGDTDSYYTEWY